LLAVNQITNELGAAWDSAGYILVSKNNALWGTPEKVNPAGPELDDSHYFALCYSDSGYGHVGWSSDAGMGSFVNGVIRTFKDSVWDTVEIVLNASAIYSDVYFIKDMAAKAKDDPSILCLHDWSSIEGNSGSQIEISYCYNDDRANYTLCEWTYNYLGAVGLRNLSDGKLMACCQEISDSCKIKSHIISDGIFSIDTAYIVNESAYFHSASLNKTGKPCVVWSDSHKIYASAFYDTMWSKTPKLVSDSSLNNCINPDVVVQDDSTMWVCYECDSEIYITRTSVPLGVEAGSPISKPFALKPCLRIYPNPARNRVNISFSTKRPSFFAVYDITGRKIKSMISSDGQTVWNCRNDAGTRVSAGVYFIRAGSEDEEIIKKINIVY
jgi:hypothetical protein